MKNNTIVTVGDMNYLWGIFLLIASMRKNNMDEPVVAVGYRFTPEAAEILTQMGDVRVCPETTISRSLTCYKPEAMLLAETEYISWVDSDAFFVGNNSARLIPEAHDVIHIRKRSPEENCLAFRGHSFGEDGQRFPKAILDVWRQDVEGRAEPATEQACSACLMSLHRSRRPFLEKWRSQMDKVLPRGDVGVVDRHLEYYHQLDESVLNSLLCFWQDAPRVSDEYKMDKSPNEKFIHFVGQPKPWNGWPPSAFRHFDAYLDVVEYAVRQGWKLPGEIPFPLRRSNKWFCRLLQHPVELNFKIRKKLRKLF